MEEETKWYFTRREIEETSPSRLDGINLKQESFQRWSYSTFLQELGKRLNNPQKAIATSIILCQRFFTRQSLAKNDDRVIAIICMFIAGKVQGSPRPVGDVIVVAYKLLNNKEPLKQVFENLKEIVLTGEKFVLSTLRFELDIELPYKLVLGWVKSSVQVERDANVLAQAALNFVNDGLRTSLCLQFKPSQIAAAAIYLGSSLTKVKLPWDGEKVWWREFGVTKRQLWDISNQTLDVYDQDFLKPISKSDVDSKFDDVRKQIKDDATKSYPRLEGNVKNVADKSLHVVDKLNLCT